MKKLIIFAMLFLVSCGIPHFNWRGVIAPTAVMPDLSKIEFIEIRTAEELMNIRYGLDKSYRLMNDIDVSEHRDGWLPLSSTLERETFSGVLDGNGYKIIASYTLFGSIRGGVVINLTLENASGRLAHYVVNGMIVGCHVSGTARASSLVQHAIDSVISGCSSSATITAGTTGDNKVSYLRAGGLVGELKNSELIDSYTTGDVIIIGDVIIGSLKLRGLKGCAEVGGVVGIASNSVLRNVYSTGNVGNIDCDIGGIAGVLENSRLDNAYATGSITGGGGVGGIVGYASRSEISNTYFEGVVGAKGAAGGIVGLMYRTDLKNVENRGTIPIKENSLDLGLKYNKPYAPYEQLY